MCVSMSHILALSLSIYINNLRATSPLSHDFPCWIKLSNYQCASSHIDPAGFAKEPSFIGIPGCFCLLQSIDVQIDGHVALVRDCGLYMSSRAFM